jgi:hypothetical protein
MSMRDVSGPRGDGNRRQRRARRHEKTLPSRIQKRHGEALDRLTAADQRFFERFPHRTHRIRVASEIEIALGNRMPAPEDCQWYAVVKNIAHGVHMKIFTLGPDGCENDLDEEFSREVYNHLASSSGAAGVEAAIRTRAKPSNQARA